MAITNKPSIISNDESIYVAVKITANFNISADEYLFRSNVPGGIHLIIDGDTIVADGEHIRLLGVDSDERGYECYKEAKDRLDEWILDKEVVLEKDKTKSLVPLTFALLVPSKLIPVKLILINPE